MTREQTGEIVDGGHYSNALFRGLSERGRRIRDVEFSDCTFDRCGFADGDLAGCAFTGCTFRTSDLSLVKLAEARFMDVRIVSSKLVGVDWTNVHVLAKLALSVGFEGCVLSQSSFFGMDMRRVQVKDCVAQDVDFRNADMSDAVCSGTDFSGARFANTTLMRADFRKAFGYAINPLQNRIAKAKFSLPEAASLLDGLDITLD